MAFDKAPQPLLSCEPRATAQVGGGLYQREQPPRCDATRCDHQRERTFMINIGIRER